MSPRTVLVRKRSGQGVRFSGFVVAVTNALRERRIAFESGDAGEEADGGFAGPQPKPP
jgi:hypothetical protein